MIVVREATLDDVDSIREVFRAEYGNHYAYPQYFNRDGLARLVYAPGSILCVAIDTASGGVAGTASVVFSVGAYNDLVGEFGRLVVHPDFRGRGIGKRLMQARIEHVQHRLHVGLVENRTAHSFSQRISERFDFVPVGLAPMKLLVAQRESVALYVRHFGDALQLRRNHPRIISEASELAGLVLTRCGVPADAIIDDDAVPFPHDEEFEVDELQTEGYASLLRIERGRVRHREVFGPIRLHYGMFQLQARHSHYLIARRSGQIAGGIGFMVDEVEKTVRVFELISRSDEPIRFLFNALLRKCQTQLRVEYVEVDVSAYSVRMQRTLLELGFFPVGYVPAGVFHQVERLDVIKMTRLLVPLKTDDLQFSPAMQTIADMVLKHAASCRVAPRVADASSQTPLFRGLSYEQRHRLLGICRPQRFEAGEAIFREGDADGTMHLILTGQVRLLQAERPIAVVAAGQCVGETALLGSTESTSLHSVSAIAQGAVETAGFPKQTFYSLMRRRPDIGVVIYRNLAVDVSVKLKQHG